MDSQTKQYIDHIKTVCGADNVTVTDYPDNGWTGVTDTSGMWNFTSHIGVLPDGRVVIFDQEDCVEANSHVPQSVPIEFVFDSVDAYLEASSSTSQL
jgi:hypothetical protein